jgi:hypothetical protein
MKNKKLLIEEVQRMRSMMGLKEDYIPKMLLKEGPGDLWGLVKTFIEADDAARVGLVATIKNDPVQKRFFDNLINKYKGVIDPSGTIRSIDDLGDLTRRVQLAAFAKELAGDSDIVKTISKYGINFSTDYAKLASLENATAGSKGEAALNGVKNADPLAGNVINKIKNNQVDDLDAGDIQLVWNEASDLLSRETDPELKRFYQEIVDDLNKAYTHKLELDNIRTDRVYYTIVDPDMGARLDTQDYEFEELYRMPEQEFKTEYTNVKKTIEKNRTAPISEDNIAIVTVAYQRGIITEDVMSELTTTKKASTWKMYFDYGKTYKEKLFSSDGVDKLTRSKEAEVNMALNKYGKERATWPPDVRSRIEIMESIIDDDFDKFIKAKALVDPAYENFTSKYTWFGFKSFGGKTLGQAYDYLFSNLNPFNARLTAKQRTQIFISWGLKAVGIGGLAILVDLLTAFGMITSFIGLETGVSDAFLINILQEWSVDGVNMAKSVGGTEFGVCENSALPWCGNGISKDDFIAIDASLNIFVSRQILIPQQLAGNDAATYIYKFDPYRFGISKDSKNIVKSGLYNDRVVAIKSSYIETLGDDKKEKINLALDKFNIPQFAPNKERLEVTTPKGTLGSLLVQNNDAQTNANVLSALQRTDGVENLGDLKVTSVTFNGVKRDNTGTYEEYSYTLDNGSSQIRKYDPKTKMFKK